MGFASVEQRMASSYLDQFPAFVPDENGIAVAAQKQFYQLIRGLYKLAYDEPLLFVPAVHEDDAYPNRFNRTSYGKPELYRVMKKFTDEVDALLVNLFRMGSGEMVKLSKRQRAALQRLDILEGEALPEGWKWMASRPGATLSAFKYCFFDPQYPYISDIYARLMGDEAAFRKLEGWLRERGYQRYECLSRTAGEEETSLTWANPAWSAKTPRGGFEYGIRHTGVSMRYDRFADSPPVLGLCVPGGMKPYLKAIGRMDERVKKFVMAHNRRCDGCRYCVQTDRTGKKPPAFVTVGEEALCTYFPGFSYCWTRINDELTDYLIAMLAFMDEFVEIRFSS